MRNFIFFIRRFFNLILFIALEVVCIVLIAQTRSLQGNDLVSSANFVSGTLYKKKNDVTYFFSLKGVNDSLMRENAALRNKIARYGSVDTFKDSAVHVPLSQDDTSVHLLKYADFTYRPARVINNSLTCSNNYITINRGSKDGIEKKMAVISGTGIVGRVEYVSAHFASVLSILSSKLKVSAKLRDGTNGYIIWDEKKPDELMMTDVPQQSKVKKGDSIFTTSYSFFPPDVLVGVVAGIESVKKNNMQLLHLHSSTNFRSLQFVYVVENKMEAERKKLEEETNKK